MAPAAGHLLHQLLRQGPPALAQFLDGPLLALRRPGPQIAGTKLVRGVVHGVLRPLSGHPRSLAVAGRHAAR
jgi:hypothetical protein